MARPQFRLAALVAATLTLACSGSDEPGANVIQADPTDASGGNTPDSSSDGSLLPADTAASDTPGAGSGDDAAGELPPGFGETCAGPDDCNSGWCYEGRCTDNCISDCPTGWSCKSITSSGSDVTFLCVPNSSVSCKPCAAGRRRM